VAELDKFALYLRAIMSDVSLPLSVAYSVTGDDHGDRRPVAFVVDGEGRYVLTDQDPPGVDDSPWCEMVVAVVNAMPVMLDEMNDASARLAALHNHMAPH
jgi:hypothetical protein